MIKLFGKQARTELFSALYGLLVLPFPDEFGIAAEEHFRHLPAVELGRSGVNRRREKAVLEAVAQCGSLVRQRAWNQSDDRVRQDRCRKLASAEDIVSA